MDFEFFKKGNPEEAARFFRNKTDFTYGPFDIDYARKENLLSKFNLVDVRAAEDYAKGHIPGAISLPEDKWESFTGLSKDKLNVLYCYSPTCHLAARAAFFFAGKGYSVAEMEGGFEEWKKYEYEVETGAKKVA